MLLVFSASYAVYALAIVIGYGCSWMWAVKQQQQQKQGKAEPVAQAMGAQRVSDLLPQRLETVRLRVAFFFLFFSDFFFFYY